MAAPFALARFQAIDADGAPLAGGKLHTYAVGTNDPEDTYQDESGSVANANPVVLDGRGEAVIFLNPEKIYTWVLEDENGDWLWSQDGVSGVVSSNEFREFKILLSGPDGAAQVGYGTRNVQEKLAESKSLADLGAAGGDEDAAPIISAIPDEDAPVVTLAGGDYVVKQAVVKGPVTLHGPGALRNPQSDKAIISFRNSSAPNDQIENIDLIGTQYGPMGLATADNFGALSFANAKAPIVALGRFKDVETAVRVGYELGGAATQDALVLGNYVRGARTMGVEAIQSQYNRIIGLAVENGGTPVGIHGVRYSGNNKGSITSASVIRDRGPSAAARGVSFQDDTRNCMATGVYVENIAGHGIGPNSGTIMPGGHVIAPAIVVDAQLDGINLERMPRSLVNAVVENAGQIGVRGGLAATDPSGHLVNAIIHGGGVAARVGGTGVYTLVTEGQNSDSPISIAGDNAIVVVSIKNGTGDNTLFIAGSNNTIIVNETANAGPVGVRVDGPGNTLCGRITGNVVINAGAVGTILQASIGRNLRIAAAGCSIAGSVAGTITQTGANNNLNGLVGASGAGSASVITDACGVASFSHGMKLPPVFVQLSPTSAPFVYIVTSKTDSAISVTLFSLDGAALADSSVTFDWEARA